MHEVGITRSIVAIVTEHAGRHKVVRVKVALGRLSGLVPKALRVSFNLCLQGTLAEGAQLDIVEICGLGRCVAGGTPNRLGIPMGYCPSCGQSARAADKAPHESGCPFIARRAFRDAA